VKLQRRLRKKKSYYVWTQGSAFAFAVGYTMTRTDMSELVQVVEAYEAEPARDRIQRDPGQIRCEVYTPDDSPGKVWKFSQAMTMSQDDFVRFLITGVREELAKE
jgi:hypothetical protein